MSETDFLHYNETTLTLAEWRESNRKAKTMTDQPAEPAEPELLPCPVCEYTGTELIAVYTDFRGWCRHCSAAGPIGNRSFAQREWNALSRIRQERDELRKDAVYRKKCYIEVMGEVFDLEAKCNELKGLLVNLAEHPEPTADDLSQDELDKKLVGMGLTPSDEPTELLPCPNPDCRTHRGSLVSRHGLPVFHICKRCGCNLYHEIWDAVSLAVSERDELKKLKLWAMAIESTSATKTRMIEEQHNELRELIINGSYDDIIPKARQLAEGDKSDGS